MKKSAGFSNLGHGKPTLYGIVVYAVHITVHITYSYIQNIIIIYIEVLPVARLNNYVKRLPYYGGKLSREKTFSFLRFRTIRESIFSAKFCGHTYIIIGPEQSAKVFVAKLSFCTETRKFSPSKGI